MATIGKLAIILSGNASSFNKMIRGAQRDLKSFSRDATAVGGTLAAAGAAMAAPLVASVAQFMREGDRIAKGARSIGVTAQQFAGLDHAAKLAGASVDDVSKGILRLSRNVYDAERGLKTSRDAFRDLGLSAEILAGQSPDEQFLRVAAALGKVEDHSRKMALAQVLLGRGASTLIPLLDTETAALRAQIAEGARLLGLTGEQALQAELLADQWTRAKTALLGASLQIGGALAPAVMNAARRMQELSEQAREWVRRNPQIITQYAKMAATLLLVGGAFLAVGKAASVMVSVLTLLKMSRVAVVALSGAVKKLIVHFIALGASGMLMAAPIIAALAAIGAAVAYHIGKMNDLKNAVATSMETLNLENRSEETLRATLKRLQMQREQIQGEMNKQGTFSNWFGAGAVLKKEYEARGEEIARVKAALDTLPTSAASAAAADAEAAEEAARHAAEVAKLVDGLEAQRRSLTMSAGELQRYALEQLNAGAAEIERAEAIRSEIAQIERLNSATGDVARDAEAFADSLEDQLATWELSSRQAEIYRLEMKLIEAQSALTSAAMREVTAAAYDQAAAQVEAAQAALDRARAADRALAAQEAADKAAEAKGLAGGATRDSRPAALERGTVAAYSAGLWDRGAEKDIAKNTERGAKAGEEALGKFDDLIDAFGNVLGETETVRI